MLGESSSLPPARAPKLCCPSGEISAFFSPPLTPSTCYQGYADSCQIPTSGSGCFCLRVYPNVSTPTCFLPMFPILSFIQLFTENVPGSGTLFPRD